MSRQRRTETLSVCFANREVEGWKFRVGDCFSMQLDIRLEDRMDTRANAEKKKRLGRNLEFSEKIKRRVWTQGVPPAYSFYRGHFFHEIEESQDGTRRSILIVLARPDVGALREIQVVDNEGFEVTVAVETDGESRGGGFVDYEIFGYKHGKLITDRSGFAIKEQSSRTQAGFAELLRTGQ